MKGISANNNVFKALDKHAYRPISLSHNIYNHKETTKKYIPINNLQCLSGIQKAAQNVTRPTFLLKVNKLAKNSFVS